jgi:hypothetical protein
MLMPGAACCVSGTGKWTSRSQFQLQDCQLGRLAATVPPPPVVEALGPPALWPGMQVAGVSTCGLVCRCSLGAGAAGHSSVVQPEMVRSGVTQCD